MTTVTFFVFELVVFMFSVIIHEVSHGVIAERLGDSTARDAGRLTLNPLKHIDPFGSIILPLLLAIPALFGQPTAIFGWAKPVPYDPRNLKNPKTGAGLIAAMGPVANLLVAVIFGILIRAVHVAEPMIFAFGTIVYVNILLAVFNLLPLPPLDGSKVLFALLPRSEGTVVLVRFLERYGLFLLLIVVFFGFGFITPIINALYNLIVGAPLGF